MNLALPPFSVVQAKLLKWRSFASFQTSSLAVVVLDILSFQKASSFRAQTVTLKLQSNTIFSLSTIIYDCIISIPTFSMRNSCGR